MRQIQQITAAVFTLVFFAKCGNTKHTEPAGTLPVTDAYYYTWVGGVEGASGTDLVIKLDKTGKRKPQFVFFRGLKLPLEVKPLQENILWIARVEGAKPKDLLMDKDHEKEYPNSPAVNVKAMHLKDDEALIQYEYEGKILYYTLKNIRKETQRPYE